MLVVCPDGNDDVEMMADSLTRFESCPVVAFLGDVEVPEAFKHAKIFGLEAVSDAAAYLHAEIDTVKG